MSVRKETTVKKTQHNCIYAVLLSLILLLPALSVQAASPSLSPVLPRTAGSSNLTITIIKPLAGATYIQNKLISGPTVNKTTFVYGQITIQVWVNGTNLSSVLFKMDNKTIKAFTSNVTAGLFNYTRLWCNVQL